MKNVAQLPVKVGDMDREITIQRSNTAISDYHNEELVWVDLETVWAKVDWQGGSETSENIDKKLSVSQTSFFVRFNEEFKSKRLRVKYDGQLFDIVAVLEIGRQAFQELKTKAYE